MQAPTTTIDSTGAPLLMAIELSNSTWKLRLGDGRQPFRDRNVKAGDLDGFLAQVRWAKRRLGLSEDAHVVSCYEAGRDGFWIHRWLESQSIESLIVHAASMDIDRRRGKTDRLDLGAMFDHLVRHLFGAATGRKVWSIVCVPSERAEDDQHLVRERDQLIGERTALTNRMESLLIKHGVRVATWSGLPTQLEKLRTPDGKALQPRLKARLCREHKRYEIVREQIIEVEKLQRQWVRDGFKAGEAPAQKVRRLQQIKGIGQVTSTVLTMELFGWRTFSNRRELGGLVGLVGTPWQSGDTDREQTISKSGSPRLRSLLVEAAWSWIRFQPHSELSKWYQRRFGGGGRRMRKIGIVALARKLLIALWHWAEHETVPEGVVLQAA